MIYNEIASLIADLRSDWIYGAFQDGDPQKGIARLADATAGRLEAILDGDVNQKVVTALYDFTAVITTDSKYCSTEDAAKLCAKLQGFLDNRRLANINPYPENVRAA